MRPVESSVTASVVSSPEATARKDLGYLPSMAAHAAHAQLHVFQDNSENSRLRKAVIEHKATIRDLSARLVKVKQSEAQNRRHSNREARSSHIEAPQRQKSDVPVKAPPQASSATQTSVPTMHNQNLTPTNTVSQISHPLKPGTTMAPPRQNVQDFGRMEQQQGHYYVLSAECQVEQRPSLAEQWLQQRYIHAFDAQLAQVEWQKERQLN